MLEPIVAYFIVLGCCAVGLSYGLLNYIRVKSVKLRAFAADGDYTPLGKDDRNNEFDKKQIDAMLQIGEYISNGAKAFLNQEYLYVGVFLFIFTFVVWGACDSFRYPWTAICFIAGGVTSVVSGYIGMMVAVQSNYRTAFEARRNLAPAFKVAFRAGCVMGFILSSLALLVLIILIAIFKPSLESSQADGFVSLQHAFDQIAGYGLGGSTVALFGRVGGGIYTKAADVGADLVGKVEEHFKEDSPRNPATIADNVGDNVGDIAGMGADLFGSFAEASSAALVVLSDSGLAINVDKITGATQIYLFAPLVLSAFGIICCLVTSLFATDLMSVDEPRKIESTLKWQLIISTVLLLGGIYFAFAITLNFPTSPDVKAVLVDHLTNKSYTITPMAAFWCAVSGLIAGFIIGWFTEYYTSNAYTPVQEVAQSCETGAATNIIYGLALGYLSTIIPIISLAAASYLSHRFLGLFGVALAALGMLSNLAVGLAIDAYGPISDNAGGIAEMAELGDHVRERTDALDAAGNTTAAIGKGFAIGSAALVSLALYSAFITRASQPETGHDNWITLKNEDITVTDGLIFAGLLVGAMLPYAFSAFTMKSVGKAALDMVREIRNQLLQNPGIRTGAVLPDYSKCIAISTNSALREMIAPGCLVIFTPLITGFLLGPKAVAGILPGTLVSGVQMAISSSNTGGAWDNAKKYIESGKLIVQGTQRKKGSKEHEAAVIGDTVGDPLKDTSGPSLNILIKLSAILSLVFVSFFRQTAVLANAIN